MKQIELRRAIIITIFAAIVLTGIYINLQILLNQTFYQIFEGDLGFTTGTIFVFVVILTFLGTIQYLTCQDRPKFTQIDTI